MQDRFAGDIGDYVKLALLRALAPGMTLGIAWYLHPDEDHNRDGRHIGYLERPDRWRHLDPELFDALDPVATGGRSVAALEAAGMLPGARFTRAPLHARDHLAAERPAWRDRWFGEVLAALEGCDLVFADPDNGLVDDAPHRRRDRVFGKQMPLSEARALAEGRCAVLYHHNSRFPGGHDLEVQHWRRQLGGSTIAVRANAWSCRTFFVVNPTPVIAERVKAFETRWARHKVRVDW